MFTFLKTNVIAQKLEKSISIDFIIKDKITDTTGISIQYYPEYSMATNFVYFDRYSVEHERGRLHLDLFNNQQYGYIRLILPKPFYDQFIDYQFLVERGDKIQITIEKGNVYFTGEGSEKFNCQLQIQSLPMNKFACDEIDSICLDRYVRAFKQHQTRQIDILNNYKNTLSSIDFDIFKLNIISTCYFNNLNLFRSFLVYSEPIYKRAVANYFLNTNNIKEINTEGINVNKIGILSNSYVDAVFQRERSLIDMKTLTARPGNPLNTFQILFDSLMSKYSGVLRDRLLVNCLVSDIPIRTTADSEKYLDSVYNFVNDDVSKSILFKKLRTSRGVMGYNFQLKDSTGTIINFSDFKGKVVIMDYYFTGCIPCIRMCKSLSPVFNNFKDNPEVVFLTINLDKSFETFKNSVRSGLYTHPGTINLYTNGQGQDHEIMEHYGFIGAPHLILFDKTGRIWDSNPIFKINPVKYQKDFIADIEGLVEGKKTK